MSNSKTLPLPTSLDEGTNGSGGDRPVCVSRVYANATSRRPRAYSDYENFSITWGNQDHYEVLKKIGRGKYSEVFLGRNRANRNKCVVKVLKPVRKGKVKREIKILQNLCGGPNIALLRDVVRDNHTNTTSLVFDYIQNVHFRDLYPKLSVLELKYYLFELLKALDFCHARGIMHRDVKPHNIMIDHRNYRLCLIDWGLAEFYRPGIEYNVRVASRYFKAPELLVDLREYNYAVDMWGVGCILASIVFNRDPMFKGRDNKYQLIQIARILGTKQLNRYLEKYNLDLDPSFDGILDDYDVRPWTSFVVPKKASFATPNAIDVIDRLLRYDHCERLSAAEAMSHSYFKDRPTIGEMGRAGDDRSSSDDDDDSDASEDVDGGDVAAAGNEEGSPITSLLGNIRSAFASALGAAAGGGGR
eukprot:g603.t1